MLYVIGVHGHPMFSDYKIITKKIVIQIFSSIFSTINNF